MTPAKHSVQLARRTDRLLRRAHAWPMWRWWAVAALALLLAAPAGAQCVRTTVTGTVTDPNNIPYSNGTISATLIFVASPGTPSGQTCNGESFVFPVTGTTDVNGSFTLSLPPNASITPAGTIWQFQVGTPGIPPPLGTGPQSFTTNVTIAGASQNISANLNASALSLTVLPIGAASSFADLTSGTNTIAAMLVGTGASLGPTGAGVVNANQVDAVPIAITTPVAGQMVCVNAGLTLENCNAGILDNPQAGANYAIAATDRGRMVTRTHTAAMADTIGQCGVTFPAGFYFYYRNNDPTPDTLTLTPAVSTINGAATLTANTQFETWLIVCNQAGNYEAARMPVSVGSTGGFWVGSNPIADTVGASTTEFHSVTGSSIFGPTESSHLSATGIACTAQKAYVTTNNAQSGTGTLVFTFRTGATSGTMADTSLVVTVGAGAAAGTFSDTSNTVSVAAGNLWSWKVVNNASATSASVNSISFVCVP